MLAIHQNQSRSEDYYSHFDGDEQKDEKDSPKNHPSESRHKSRLTLCARESNLLDPATLTALMLETETTRTSFKVA